MKPSRSLVAALTIAASAAQGGLAAPAHAEGGGQPIPIEGAVGPGEAFVGGLLKILGVPGPGASE